VAGAPTSAKQATISAITYAPTAAAAVTTSAALWMAGAIEPAPILMARTGTAATATITLRGVTVVPQIPAIPAAEKTARAACTPD